MAKYLGIPLTVSNGNKTPLTAQPELVETTVTQSSDWLASATSPSTASITSDGGLVNVVSGNFAYVRTNVNSLFTIGKSYTATIRLQRTSGSGGGVGVRQTVGSPITIKNLTGGIQEITYNFTAYVDDQLYILREGTGDYSFLVSYVSIKEIAATETPTYGSPEYVTNGEFADASGWNITHGGWNASGPSSGSWACDGTQTQSTNLGQGNALQGLIGKKIAISFEITAYTAGSVRFVTGDGSIAGPQKSNLGTHELISVVTSEGAGYNINIQATSDFVGSVSNVSVKEIPFVMGTQNLFPTPLNASDYGGEGEKSILGNRIFIKNDGSVNPYSQFQYLNLLEDDKLYTVTFDLTVGAGSYSLYYTTEGIVNLPGTGTYTFNLYGSSMFYIGCNFSGDTTWSLSNIVINEAEYNYLQVADGGFKKSVKEGDVIFNTSTSTEGVVKQVLDNNVLLMSNDNFSTAGEFFNVFAANGDTRGNQVVRTDNYIMSEYDENASNPQETSFWFAGGVNADKVALTQLNPATNTFFVAGVIEEYLERLNAQSATASRLDIPLDAFRDHKYNEVLTTTAITLS